MKNHSLSLIYSFSQPTCTEKLGAELASLCSKSCVLFLKGVLGAGKTTFSRGFVKQLTGTKRVKSPSYTLLELYNTVSSCIIHLDLYRLTNPLELEYIGIRDYMQNPALWLIEWPEKATQDSGLSLLPTADIVIEFSLLPSNHHLELTANTAKGNQLLQKLAHYD